MLTSTPSPSPPDVEAVNRHAMWTWYGTCCTNVSMVLSLLDVSLVCRNVTANIICWQLGWFWSDCSWGCNAPFSQRSPSHSFSYLPDFFWQFYNSLCRNLPRRYVLPLTVDQKTPLDQNLVTLNSFKATATMTKPGEVRLNLVENTHLAYEGMLYCT